MNLTDSPKKYMPFYRNVLISHWTTTRWRVGQSSSRLSSPRSRENRSARNQEASWPSWLLISILASHFPISQQVERPVLIIISMRHFPDNRNSQRKINCLRTPIVFVSRIAFCPFAFRRIHLFFSKTLSTSTRVRPSVFLMVSAAQTVMAAIMELKRLTWSHVGVKSSV